jgi:hypothetical protein
MLNYVLADHDKSVLAPFTIAVYVLPRDKIFIAFRDAVNVMNGTLRPDFVVFNLNQMDLLISEETSRQFLAYMRGSLPYRKVADIENVIIFANSDKSRYGGLWNLHNAAWYGHTGASAKGGASSTDALAARDSAHLAVRCTGYPPFSKSAGEPL